LIGRLTRDCEFKSVKGGTVQIAEFGLAVGKKKKNRDTGAYEDHTSFFDVTAFGKAAEIARDYVKKGDMVSVLCDIEMDSWTDKTTGQKRSKHVFNVIQLTLLPNPKRDGEGGGGDYNHRDQNDGGGQANGGSVGGGGGEEEIPF
jgi:single-strand DNA-binding protein